MAKRPVPIEQKEVPEWLGLPSVRARREHTAFVLAYNAVRWFYEGDTAGALGLCDEIADRFGQDRDPASREYAARSLANKSAWLYELGRCDEAVSTCDEIARRFRGDSVPDLQKLVIKALSNQSVWLHELGNREKALSVGNKIVSRYKNNDPRPEEYYEAIRNQIKWLRELGRDDEARAYVEEYFPAPQPALSWKEELPVSEASSRQQVEMDLNSWLNDVTSTPPPPEGGIMRPTRKNTDDAKPGGMFELAVGAVGVVEAAKVIVRRASPDERALIAGMALPEHEDIFQAIILAKKEFAARRADFSKPPLPRLSPEQLAAIKQRAKDRPWGKRGDDKRNPFEWVRDNYKEWAGFGLLQAHLKADRNLYEAFAKAAKRLGLPEWLDVPTEGDALIRRLVKPEDQLRALVARHLHSATMKMAKRFLAAG
ncbi:MAG: tetratricopeptide repeat protein [Roseiarcus sp.]